MSTVSFQNTFQSQVISSGRLFTTSVSMSTHCATSRCRTRFVVLVGSSDNSLLSYEAAAAAFFMRVWAKAVAARQGQKHQPCKLIVCSLGGKRLQRRRSSVLPAKGVQGQLLYYVLFHTVTQCSKIWWNNINLTLGCRNRNSDANLKTTLKIDRLLLEMNIKFGFIHV